MATIVLSDAVWVDSNPNFTQGPLPDQLPDAAAVMSSGLLNLFGCPVGARGRTFQPEYGIFWLNYLQEPINRITARSMTMGMFQAIKRWEPRIQIDQSYSNIIPDLNIPGYRIRLGMYMKQGSSLLHKMQFDLKV